VIIVCPRAARRGGKDAKFTKCCEEPQLSTAQRRAAVSVRSAATCGLVVGNPIYFYAVRLMASVEASATPIFMIGSLMCGVGRSYMWAVQGWAPRI